VEILRWFAFKTILFQTAKDAENAAPARSRNQNGFDPADLGSVVRVLLHYMKTPETVAAPTELVSVERMILHSRSRIVGNHGSTETSSAGAYQSEAGSLSAKSCLHRASSLGGYDSL
jgi:hypothetical protein